MIRSEDPLAGGSNEARRRGLEGRPGPAGLFRLVSSRVLTLVGALESF